MDGLSGVTLLGLAALGGFLAGFALHLWEQRRRPPDPVIIMLPEGSPLSDAGILLRKVAEEIEQLGWGRELLSGLAWKDRGAVYTPETSGKTAIRRFTQAAVLCDELHVLQQRQHRDEHRHNCEGGGPEPFPVASVEADKGAG